jgi:hypothetical protein
VIRLGVEVIRLGVEVIRLGVEVIRLGAFLSAGYRRSSLFSAINDLQSIFKLPPWASVENERFCCHRGRDRASPKQPPTPATNTRCNTL